MTATLSVNRTSSFDYAAALSLMEQKLLQELSIAKWDSDSALVLLEHFANLALGHL